MKNDYAFLNNKRFYKETLKQALPSYHIPEDAELLFIVNPDARVLGEHNDHLVYIHQEKLYAAVRPRWVAYELKVNREFFMNLADLMQVDKGKTPFVRFETAKKLHNIHYHHWHSLESSVERKLL